MKATDHLKMPELINSEYRVYMEEPEQAIYDEMCEDLAAQLDKGEVTAANAGVLSGKLCQMANGAVYTDNGDVEHIHDQKLDALEDIIESMNGKPLLVAYWYQHDLDRIEERLRLRKIGFARLDSDASIAKWNRGEIPVALIHPASAGHGLNLQSGGAPSAGLALPGAWNCISRRWRGFTGRVRRPRPWSYSTSSRTAPLMSAL